MTVRTYGLSILLLYYKQWQIIHRGHGCYDLGFIETTGLQLIEFTTQILVDGLCEQIVKVQVQIQIILTGELHSTIWLV